MSGAKFHVSIAEQMTFQTQADVILNQVNPVSGTLYEVGGTGFWSTFRNVRIKLVNVAVIWTVQPTPLNVIITIDGIAKTWTFVNPVSNTSYAPSNSRSNFPEATTRYLMVAYNAPRDIPSPFIEEGRIVKVEVQTTGGTVQALKALVEWAKR